MGMYIQDDYWEAAQALNDKQRAEFFDAIVTYHFAGEEPTATGVVAACFALCRDRIDKAKQSQENGRKGGRPKAEPNENQTANQKKTQSEPKAEPNENQTETGSIKEREREIEIEEQVSSETCSDTFSNENVGRASARPKATAAQISEVIDHLNAKTGKQFKSTTPKTRQLISARISEGFTVGDCKRVIDNMCQKWAGVTSSDGRSMEDYLRPSTLFRPSNFEGYLNGDVSVPKPQKERGFYITGSAEGDRELRERMGGA